jgi:hypothetical protein
MTDDDCIEIYGLYEKDGSCCQSCSTDAVAKRWLAEAARACSAMGGEGCPKKKCVALERVACVAQQCTVKRTAATPR